LHTASGPVIALRKKLFRPIDTKYGDDCILPLDVLEQGYRIIHDDDAVAYDKFPSTVKGEISTRTRMTLRNITGTLSKMQLLNPINHTSLSISIISHKILRWLTPYFMLLLLVANITLQYEDKMYLAILGAQGVFYMLGLIGFFGERYGRRFHIASQIFSFIVANIGFFNGIIKAISGKRISIYKAQD
jgi:cellulose synthase/poly-beta-1,6-N-acetylglucosamine synthase-like glycosyltransferase